MVYVVLLTYLTTLLFWYSPYSVRDHSPQLGWALDGFPVFGPVGAKGTYIVLAMEVCITSYFICIANSIPLHSHILATTGIAMLPCGGAGAHPVLCLDVCGGYQGKLPGYDKYLYRYYVPGPLPTGE